MQFLLSLFLSSRIFCLQRSTVLVTEPNNTIKGLFQRLKATFSELISVYCDMTPYAAISDERVASIICNYPDDAGSVYFEMPVFLYQTIQRHIPMDSNIYSPP